MSSLEFDFSQNLKLIKELVCSKSIGNLKQLELSGSEMMAKLSADNREIVSKAFFHLLYSFKKYLPVENVEPFLELAKLYLADDLHDGLLFSSVSINHTDHGLQEEMDKMTTLLEQYCALCAQMGSSSKQSLKTDLEHVNMGQSSKQMSLSSEQYAELCVELHNFVQPLIQ